MIKDNIEKQLRSWLSEKIKKYTWLRIKFEFNESRGVFMVSFSPKSHIEHSDEFNIDAMQFADKMNAIYGNEAPLFTDEEYLFTLSPNAEVVETRSFISVGCSLPYSTRISVHPKQNVGVWASSTTSTTAPTGRNFRQTPTEASYAFAA